MFSCDRDERYTSIRTPVWLADELDALVRELEQYLAQCTSTKQQDAVYLPATPTERWGIPKWFVLARLLREHKLKKARHEKYLEKKREKRQSTK